MTLTAGRSLKSSAKQPKPEQRSTLSGETPSGVCRARSPWGNSGVVRRGLGAGQTVSSDLSRSGAPHQPKHGWDCPPLLDAAGRDRTGDGAEQDKSV